MPEVGDAKMKWNEENEGRNLKKSQSNFMIDFKHFRNFNNFLNT